MENKTDNELLADVLAEAAPADFRDAMLAGTLRLARRRRRFRQTRRAAGLLCVLALAGVLIWQRNQQPTMPSFPPRPTAQAAERSCHLVKTRPLPARDIVTTRPLAAADFVASNAAVNVVQTVAGNYRVIDDKQLLALLGNKPAILIRTGPHSEELVFANPEDEKGFRLH